MNTDWRTITFSSLPDELNRNICEKALDGLSGHEVSLQLARLKDSGGDLAAAAKGVETADSQRLAQSLRAVGCQLPTSPSLGLLRAAAKLHCGSAVEMTVTPVTIVRYPQTPDMFPIEMANGEGHNGRTFTMVAGGIYWGRESRQDRDIILASQNLPSLDDDLTKPAMRDFRFLARQNDGRFPRDLFSGGRIFPKTQERTRLVEEEGRRFWQQVLVDRTSGEDVFQQRIARETDKIIWGYGGDGSLLIGHKSEQGHMLAWTQTQGLISLLHLSALVDGHSIRNTLMDASSRWLMQLFYTTAIPERAGEVTVHLADTAKEPYISGTRWETHTYSASVSDSFYWSKAEDSTSAGISRDFVALRVDGCPGHLNPVRANDPSFSNHVMAWARDGRMAAQLDISASEIAAGRKFLGLTLCENILAVADNERGRLSRWSTSSRAAISGEAASPLRAVRWRRTWIGPFLTSRCRALWAAFRWATARTASR